jgi:hypothetical protein
MVTVARYGHGSSFKSVDDYVSGHEFDSRRRSSFFVLFDSTRPRCGPSLLIAQSGSTTCAVMTNARERTRAYTQTTRRIQISSFVYKQNALYDSLSLSPPVARARVRSLLTRSQSTFLCLIINYTPTTSSTNPLHLLSATVDLDLDLSTTRSSTIKGDSTRLPETKLSTTSALSSFQPGYNHGGDESTGTASSQPRTEQTNAQTRKTVKDTETDRQRSKHKKISRHALSRTRIEKPRSG